MLQCSLLRQALYGAQRELADRSPERLGLLWPISRVCSNPREQFLEGPLPGALVPVQLPIVAVDVGEMHLMARVGKKSRLSRLPVEGVYQKRRVRCNKINTRCTCGSNSPLTPALVLLLLSVLPLPGTLSFAASFLSLLPPSLLVRRSWQLNFLAANRTSPCREIKTSRSCPPQPWPASPVDARPAFCGKTSTNKRRSSFFPSTRSGLSMY